MIRVLAYLTKAPQLFHEIALGGIVYLVRLPQIRKSVPLSETYFLGRTRLLFFDEIFVNKRIRYSWDV
jgi:hypothetical protein